jgi:hypothetical protein
MDLSIRDVHRLYDIYSVLGVSSRRSWMVCPLPQHTHYNNTPSFSIFTSPDGVQRWKCHGNCGLQGDVIDLVGYMQIPNYDHTSGEHVRMAAGLLGGSFEITMPKIERRSTIAPNTWAKYHPPGMEIIQYAKQRGLNETTLSKFKIGQFKHFMAIPTFEEGILRGIKFRNTWPAWRLDNSMDGLRFWAAKGSTKALFNHDAVSYTEDALLLVKGEIPAMLCDQLGFLACATTGGEGSYIERWANILSFAQRVVVVGDNDRDPVVREKMVAKAYERAKILHGEVRFPPEQFKDIDEWILADPKATHEITEWLGGK